MTKKLNQILSTEKMTKKKAEELLTELHKATQKTDLVEGFSKTYSPLKADDLGLPPQSKEVQYNATTVFKDLSKVLGDLFNTTAAKDSANCNAKADVVVDGTTILSQVPATYLLFLDKKLTDFNTFVSKFAELDSAVAWTFDENAGTYKSQSAATQRTEKLQEAIVMYQATDKHPAQTQLITRDVPVGYWNHVRFSGALSRPRKTQLLDRIQKLQTAVKEALETANMVDVAESTAGTTVMTYLFG